MRNTGTVAIAGQTQTEAECLEKKIDPNEPVTILEDAHSTRLFD